MNKGKTGAKIIIFIVIVAVLFCGVNYLIQPFWRTDDDTYAEKSGFYELPHNSLQTVFLGTSVIEAAVIPAELYENYGICSYNLGTALQPMMASYYWLEEAYRLHPETLDTVVLDVSELKNEEPNEDQAYLRTLENMRFSKVKYHFLRDVSSNFTEFLSYFLPVVSLHDRWKELSDADFYRFLDVEDPYLLGYGLHTDRELGRDDSYTEISVPYYVVENSEEAETYDEEVLYLEKMIGFCEEHDLNLLFIKTPQAGVNPWLDTAHNTAQAIAEQHQIDFIDFNYSPYIDEIEFSFATDTFDEIHMNYYGASKLTDWLGAYLTENYENKDAREEASYAFMKEDLEDYSRDLLFTTLDSITDPVQYLSYVMGLEDYEIFLSVRDDAADSLTEEQRDQFASLGLSELSELSYRASYFAVIDEGEIQEQLQEAGPEKGLEDIIEADSEVEDTSISMEGTLGDKTTFFIRSAGYNDGSVSSIKINGKEYSPNARGLNIVVYDKKLKKAVNAASFDTSVSPERDGPNDEQTLRETIQNDGTAALSGKLRQLYLYDRLCEETQEAKLLRQEAGEENLADYLQAFCGEEDLAIYLSLSGDIMETFADQEKAALEKMGLSELADLQEGESYLAVIQNGTVLAEQCGTDGEEIQVSGQEYKVSSDVTEEGDGSSIMIEGTEYADTVPGLHIVLYDALLDHVVDSSTYTADQSFVSEYFIGQMAGSE